MAGEARWEMLSELEAKTQAENCRFPTGPRLKDANKHKVSQSSFWHSPTIDPSHFPIAVDLQFIGESSFLSSRPFSEHLFTMASFTGSSKNIEINKIGSLGF